MKPERQRIAIAEACGWASRVVEVEHTLSYTWTERLIVWTAPSGKDEPLPDYLHDLNAMHQVEKVLEANQQVTFACYLTESVRDQIFNVIPNDLNYYVCFPALHTTAAQRAEAFLRTIGKWEES